MRSNCLLLWLVVVGVTSVVLLCSTIVSEQIGQQVNGPARVQSARQRFKLPRIVHFQLYKRLFHKTYGYLEELVRRKYVMARAVRAWTSSIKYKFRMSSFYLALNHLSDRSPQELKRRLNRHSGMTLGKVNTVLGAGVGAYPKTTLAADEASNTGSRNRERRDGGQLEEEWAALEAPGRELIQREPIRAGKGNSADSELGDKVKRQQEGSDDQLEAAPEPQNMPIDPRESQIEQLNQMYVAIDEGGDDGNWLLVNETSFFAGRDDPSKPDELFIDHRQSNCMFMPRDQGACGSCYAFATIAMMEWLYCKRMGKLVAFSEQYLIDCGFLVGGSGCDGGAHFEMAQFIETFGLELRQSYPYRFKDDHCAYDATVSAKSMGHIRMKLKTIMWVPLRRLEVTLSYGPMYIGTSEMDGFAEYGGGVMDGRECRPEAAHAVVLVGHGREDGKEYWLIRNSYSVGWGEAGYFKLAKESDCLHYRAGFLFGTNDGKEFIHEVEENVNNERQATRTHYISNLIIDSDLKQF